MKSLCAINNIKTLNFIGIVGKDETKFLNEVNSLFKIELNYQHIRKSKFDFKLIPSDLALLKDKLSEEFEFFDEVLKLLK